MQVFNRPAFNETIKTLHVSVPGLGQAAEYVMDTSNFFVASDWAGPQLPHTRKFCRTPIIAQESYLLQSVSVIITPNPPATQSPLPMPLSLS